MVIYDWIEWLRENAFTFLQAPEESKGEEIEVASGDQVEDSLHTITAALGKRRVVPCPTIIYGEPLVDRKSKFQAYLARVRDLDQIYAVLRQIRSDQKVLSAAHPTIFAFRLSARGDQPAHDFRDDDGETGAANRMLALLQRMELTDVLIVVTRWFGGVLLGPDRFKHISGRCKILLEQLRAEGDAFLPLPPESPPELFVKQSEKEKRSQAFQEQWKEAEP
eukprot:TRINITY_DN10019_c0_g1_i4.p1 TRINITY_DN10019_c0_g1~~TRINITY_DN10019_c0_g1_i4.p1  ORF type:complete len:221 (-),score=20.55 TRINITY_DN10019_c0_g1_i4:35-697(-)